MALPTGLILLWSGAIVDIPAGFVLCDGNNGTPNLTDRFVVGAGAAYTPDDTGGALTHTHPFSANTHFHTHPSGSGQAAGIDYLVTTSNTIVTGTTNAGSSLPPYYALAYIMKT